MGMHRQWLFMLLAAVVLTATGEATSVLKYRQWKWNMKGDVLVIAYGSLRMHGNHPPYPDVKAPAECASACSDIAGCNGWTFCNKTDGCGTGCNSYLQGHPIIPSEDPSVTGHYGLPLSTKLTDLVRPGPFEGLCRWSKNDTWNFGTCSLKMVASPAKPEFWSKREDEGWVSGTIERPSKCGNTIAARSCDKCYALKVPSLIDLCVKCAKSTIKSSSNPSPVIRTLIDAAPVTTDGCAACATLKDPKQCIACLTGNKKCAECALQKAAIRVDQNPDQQKLAFDVKVCLDCVLANGERTKDACLYCGRLKTTSKKNTCKSCVTAQKTRVCDSSKQQYSSDCVPAGACSVCADAATVPSTCTACLKQRPYNPDCISCAYAKGAPRQKQCYDCAKKKTVYDSQSWSMSACYECTSLDGGDRVEECIDNCALRADLPVSVPRFWCSQCAKDRDLDGQNNCYDCLVANATDPWKCNK